MSDYEAALENRRKAEEVRLNAAPAPVIEPEVVDAPQFAGGDMQKPISVGVYNQTMQVIDTNFKLLTKHASDSEIEHQKLVVRVAELEKRFENLEGKTASEGNHIDVANG